MQEKYYQPTLEGMPDDPLNPAAVPVEGAEGAPTVPFDATQGAETQPPVAGATEVLDTQTDAAEQQHDAEIRYEDTELLGKSFRVRRAVQEAGTQGIKTWQGLRAKVRNALDSPGKALRQFAYDRAKGSYERKDARLKAATSVRLQERRQKAANKAEERMVRREGSLNERIDRMDNRTKAVHEHATRRRQEYIDELKGKRQSALARKTLRTQLRSEGASRRETKAIMAEVPASHLDHVGEVALMTETTKRKFAEAEHTKGKIGRRQKIAGKIVSFAEGRMEGYDQKTYQADESAREISTILLPHAEGYAAQLQEKLDGLEEGSPDYDFVAAELKKADDSVTAHKAQLQHWRNAAGSSRRKSGRVDGGLGYLYDLQDVNDKRAKTASKRTDALGKTNDAHRDQLRQAVDAALNAETTRTEG